MLLMKIYGGWLCDHQVLDKMEKLCRKHCTCGSTSLVMAATATVVVPVKMMIQFGDEIQRC